MAANILNSDRAVEMSVQVVRAFVRLRQMASGIKELASRIDTLERKMTSHDENFAVVFKAIRELMNPPESPSRGRIGFRKRDD